MVCSVNESFIFCEYSFSSNENTVFNFEDNLSLQYLCISFSKLVIITQAFSLICSFCSFVSFFLLLFMIIETNILIILVKCFSLVKFKCISTKKENIF